MYLVYNPESGKSVLDALVLIKMEKYKCINTKDKLEIKKNNKD